MHLLHITAHAFFTLQLIFLVVYLVLNLLDLIVQRTHFVLLRLQILLQLAVDLFLVFLLLLCLRDALILRLHLFLHMSCDLIGALIESFTCNVLICASFACFSCSALASCASRSLICFLMFSRSPVRV